MEDGEQKRIYHTVYHRRMNEDATNIEDFRFGWFSAATD